MKDMMNNFRVAGSVVRISVRPKRAEPVMIVNHVEAVIERGLKGDRYNNRGGARQVTIIEQEGLDAMASFLDKDTIDFSLTRRNILVKGVNLISLKGKQFRIGQALFSYTGECHPCSRMEEAFGFGAYNAMRGHGGITARVIEGGMINIGDRLEVVAVSEQRVTDV